MKKIGIIAICSLFSTTFSFAQMAMDAYRSSQSELSGSARSVAMGGAFGALGGDMSALTSNPAGLGVYQSAEIAATVNFMTTDVKTNMAGNAMNQSHFKFNLDNIGTILSFSGGNGGRVNVGFSYNKKYSYSNRYYVDGYGMTNNSIGNFIAAQTNRDGGVLDKTLDLSNQDADPFNTSNWLSVLGFNSALIKPQRPVNSYLYDPITNPGEKIDNSMYLDERGSSNEYTFSLGGSMLDNRLYLGTSFVITDIDYYLNSSYMEWLYDGGEFEIVDNLTTQGAGFNMKLGAIFRPINALRIGIAYHSPSWYSLTDYFDASVHPVGLEYTDANNKTWAGSDTYTPEYNYMNYNYHTPGKWLVSAAGILGKRAIVSADWEITNYRQMNLDYYRSEQANNDIDNYFRTSYTLRVGAELKLSPQFSLRGGAEFRTGAVNPDVVTAVANRDMEIVTAGTTTHFTLDKGSNTYTFGLGYRITKSFYTDLACALMRYNADYYNFSPIPGEVYSERGTVKTNRTKVLWTLGYKF